MTAPVLRWGVLGTGWVATRFVGALRRHSSQIVVAVGSRTARSAVEFAHSAGVERAYASYEEVMSDPDVDVVYVATPHHLHVEHGLLALESGKHVLIEKPIALSSDGLEQLIAAGAARGLLVQEALWTFFLPKFDVIKQLVESDALGDICSVIADHGEWFEDGHRIHDPALAGGALNDLGVYPLALSTWLLGLPTAVCATSTRTDRGVTADVAVILAHGSGSVSSLSTTLRANTPCRATIAGSRATLAMDDGFMVPGGFTVEDHRSRRRLRYDEAAVRHEALHFQAAEVARRITAGDSQSPTWSHDRSREVVATLEATIEAAAGPGFYVL